MVVITAPHTHFSSVCGNECFMGGTREFATIFNTVINTRLTTPLVRGKDTVLHFCHNFTYKEKRPWFSETTYLSYSTPVVSRAQCQHEHLAPCSSPTTANFITTNFSNKSSHQRKTKSIPFEEIFSKRAYYNDSIPKNFK